MQYKIAVEYLALRINIFCLKGKYIFAFFEKIIWSSHKKAVTLPIQRRKRNHNHIIIIGNSKKINNQVMKTHTTSITSHNKHHYRELLSIGIPIIIGQLGTIIQGFADTLMIGHHSTPELAAAGLVNNILRTHPYHRQTLRRRTHRLHRTEGAQFLLCQHDYGHSLHPGPHPALFQPGAHRTTGGTAHTHPPLLPGESGIGALYGHLLHDEAIPGWYRTDQGGDVGDDRRKRGQHPGQLGFDLRCCGIPGAGFARSGHLYPGKPHPHGYGDGGHGDGVQEIC